MHDHRDFLPNVQNGQEVVQDEQEVKMDKQKVPPPRVQDTRRMLAKCRKSRRKYTRSSSSSSNSSSSSSSTCKSITWRRFWMS